MADVDGQIVAWNDGRTVAVLETEDWFYVALNYRDRDDETDRLWVLDPAPVGEYRLATYEERVRLLKELPRECDFRIDNRGRVVDIKFWDSMPDDVLQAEQERKRNELDKLLHPQKQQEEKKQEHTTALERTGLVFLPYLKNHKQFDRDFPKFFDEDFADARYLQLITQTVGFFVKAQNRGAHAYILSKEYELNLVKMGEQLKEIDFTELMQSHLKSGVLCLSNNSGYNAILWNTPKKGKTINMAFLCDCSTVAAIATCSMKGKQQNVLMSKRIKDGNNLAYSMFRILYLFLYAEKNGQVREVDYDCTENAKYVTFKGDKVPDPFVEYRNATYYTTINVDTPFAISGHWRNQFCGRDKDGNPIHKRIWIEEHIHSGYHRIAGILKEKLKL